MQRMLSDPHQIMDVNDISANTTRYIDHTKRITNSLDPHYTVFGIEIQNIPNPKSASLPLQIATSCKLVIFLEHTLAGVLARYLNLVVETSSRLI